MAAQDLWHGFAEHGFASAEALDYSLDNAKDRRLLKQRLLLKLSPPLKMSPPFKLSPLVKVMRIKVMQLSPLVKVMRIKVMQRSLLLKGYKDTLTEVQVLRVNYSAESKKREALESHITDHITRGKVSGRSSEPEGRAGKWQVRSSRLLSMKEVTNDLLTPKLPVRIMRVKQAQQQRDSISIQHVETLKQSDEAPEGERVPEAEAGEL
nr:unnamed protein product [Digitaria exilis]